MIRFAFRLVGYVLVAFGFALLVIDGTTSVASGVPAATSLGEALAKSAPVLLLDAHGFIETKLGVDAWRGVEASILVLPAFIVLMLAGLAAAALGRRPKPEIGFATLR